MAPIRHGFFVVSLDLEMYWGVRDVCSLSRYGQNFAAERKRIPELLELFERRGIHATWAAVGLLFLENKQEIGPCGPKERPTYDCKELSPYDYQESNLVGSGEETDPFHYALSLIREIQDTPHQRLGTHTFSHYYCLEKGQTARQFAADLEAAVQVARQQGIRLESLVFPRNQLNEAYLPCLKGLGIGAYRGNPRHPLYRKGNGARDPLPVRALRLLDSYVNLTGHHTYELSKLSGAEGELPLNIPASRFFRSYSPRLKRLEPLRIRRILEGMTRAARRGEIYHLWWHPYNLADPKGVNLKNLERIIEHYERLREEYGMESANMEELAELTAGGREQGFRLSAEKEHAAEDLSCMGSPEQEVVGSGA